MQDLFDQPLAIDPNGNGGEGAIVANAEFQVFLPEDLSFTTPLVVTDPVSGLPITPLRSSSIGQLPQFRVEGDPESVVLKSGAYAVRVLSPLGVAKLAVSLAGLSPEVVQAAIDAAGVTAESAAAALEQANLAGERANAAAEDREAAETARDDAIEARDAAQAVGATTDAIVAPILSSPSTASGAALRATIAEAVEGIEGAGFDPASVGAGLRMRAATADRMSRTNPDVTVLGLVSVNAASFVSGAVDRVYAYDRVNNRINPALLTSTGRAVQAGATSPRFNMIARDSTVINYSPGIETGTGLRCDTLSIHKEIDIILLNSGSGTQYIYVDDVLVATVTVADFTQSGVAAGLQARLGLRFSTDAPKVIGWEAIGGNAFVGFDVPSGVPLTRPAIAGDFARTLFVSDSFGEGTGSGVGRPLSWWAPKHLGWRNCWKMGSGSVGYVADGERTAWEDQVANLITLAPRRLVVALSYNDRAAYEAGGSAFIAKVRAFYETILAALPYLDVFVFGPWPNGGGQGAINASLIAMDHDLEALMKDLGIGYWSPIKSAWKFTLSDATHPDTLGHQKLGWLIAGVLDRYMPSARGIPLAESSILPTAAALPEPFTIVDTFERADTATSGGNFLGTTERGGKTWNLIGTPSAAYVLSGMARLTATGRSGVGVDVASGNGHIRAILGAFPAAGIIGLWARCTDATAGLILALNSDGTSAGTLGYCLLERTSSGVTPIVTSTVAPAIGDVIDMYLNGTSVKVRVNGVEILSTNAAPAMAGTIAGFYTNGSGNSGAWRDFLYSAAVAPWV